MSRSAVASSLPQGGEGMIFGFLGYAAFSASDVAIKALGSGVPVFQVSFLLALFSLLLMPLTFQQGDTWHGVLKMRHPRLVLFRSVAGTLAGLFAIVAFTTIPIAEAYALIFVAPLLALVLAALVLRETVGWARWVSVGIGVCGVLVVMRPGFREIELGHICGFAASFCIAASLLSIRVLGATERRVTIYAVLMVVNLVLMLPLMLWQGVVMPDLRQWLLVIFAGVGGGAGQLFLMAATRRTAANRIAPAQYSQLAWAILAGIVLFKEVPDGFVASGLALIAVSGLFLMQRRQKPSLPLEA